MGAVAVFRGRHTIRYGDDTVAGALQADGDVQRRHYVLHGMAEPAVGTETAVEPLCGHHKDETVVDNINATAPRGGTGRRGVYHTHAVLGAGHDVLLLADGLRERHARHSGGRLLYAGAVAARTDVVRGHKVIVLQDCDDFRTRGAGDDSGELAGHLPQQHSLLVEPAVLRLHGTVHSPVAVALLRTAAPGRGPAAGGRDGKGHSTRAVAHDKDVLQEGAGAGGNTVHAAVPHA